MRACAAGCASGVVVGVLVERHVVVGVAVTEDVATLATVVSSRPVVEVTPTGRLVADGGIVVVLPGVCVSPMFIQGHVLVDHVNVTCHVVRHRAIDET